jgi:hypothetical protein
MPSNEQNLEKFNHGVLGLKSIGVSRRIKEENGFLTKTPFSSKAMRHALPVLRGDNS